MKVEQTEQLTVTNEELYKMLGCGRRAAQTIGKDAGARIKVGRRILWNVSKIRAYLDKAAEGGTNETGL